MGSNSAYLSTSTCTKSEAEFQCSVYGVYLSTGDRVTNTDSWADSGSVWMILIREVATNYALKSSNTEVLIPWIKRSAGWCYGAFLPPHLGVPVEMWEFSGRQKGRSKPVKCPDYHFTHINTSSGKQFSWDSFRCKQHAGAGWYLLDYLKFTSCLLNLGSLKSTTMGVFTPG